MIIIKNNLLNLQKIIISYKFSKVEALYHLMTQNYPKAVEKAHKAISKGINMVECKKLIRLTT